MVKMAEQYKKHYHHYYSLLSEMLMLNYGGFTYRIMCVMVEG